MPLSLSTNDRTLSRRLTHLLKLLQVDLAFAQSRERTSISRYSFLWPSELSQPKLAKSVLQNRFSCCHRCGLRAFTSPLSSIIGLICLVVHSQHPGRTPDRCGRSSNTTQILRPNTTLDLSTGWCPERPRSVRWDIVIGHG